MPTSDRINMSNLPCQWRGDENDYHDALFDYYGADANGDDFNAWEYDNKSFKDDIYRSAIA